MTHSVATAGHETATAAPPGANHAGWRERLAGPADTSGLARVQRIVARFIGCGLLALTVCLLPVVIDRSELTAWWWPLVSVLLVAAPSTALVVATYRPRPPNLTAFGILLCATLTLAVTSWFVAWNGDVAPDNSRWAVWMIQFIGVPGLVLSLAGHHRWAFFYILGSTLLAHTANQVGIHGHLELQMYLNALLTIALICVFLSITVVTRRTAEVLDEEQAAAMHAASASAASTAQEQVRARFAGLTHDRVMAILQSVHRGRQHPGLAAQAFSALDELDHRGHGDPSDHGVTADDFGRRICAAVEFTDPAADCQVHIDADDAARYPVSAMSGILEATCEAVRNWRRHAGTASACTVTCELTTDRAHVCVVDDGPGFDPAAVAPERLGLLTGIVGRMDALPGAHAQVRSASGHGTTIVLEWVRDAAQ